LGAALTGEANGPLATRFQSAGAPRAADAEATWYAQRLHEHGGTALAAWCGYGRLLVPLVDRRLSIHGVDPSSAMLAACAAQLPAHGDTPTLFRQHVAHLNVPFRYACAFAAGGSFQQLVDPAVAAAALARIRAHLVAPGVLYLDLFVPAPSRQRLAAPLVEVRTVALPDGSRITLRSETTLTADARLARSENRYSHRQGNEPIGEEYESRTFTWYTPDEAVEFLAAAGFREVTVEDSPTGQDDDEWFALSARV
jgi:SAM-dependent methyltransferase